MSAFGVNGVSENTFRTFVLLREGYGKVCSLCSHAVIIISSGDASLSFGWQQLLIALHFIVQRCSVQTYNVPHKNKIPDEITSLRTSSQRILISSCNIWWRWRQKTTIALGRTTYWNSVYLCSEYTAYSCLSSVLWCGVSSEIIWSKIGVGLKLGLQKFQGCHMELQSLGQK